MGDHLELLMCCAADEMPDVGAPPAEPVVEAAPPPEPAAAAPPPPPPEPAAAAPPPTDLGDAVVVAAAAGQRVVYRVTFEFGGVLGFDFMADGPTSVAIAQLRPASDGSAGRSEQLGMQKGDIVLQIAGTDIRKAAAANGSTAFEEACALLRNASFPLQVTLVRPTPRELEAAEEEKKEEAAQGKQGAAAAAAAGADGLFCHSYLPPQLRVHVHTISRRALVNGQHPYIYTEGEDIEGERVQ